jgi:hypothetical protein
VARVGDMEFNIFKTLSKAGTHRLCKGIKYTFSSKNIEYTKGTGVADNYINAL